MTCLATESNSAFSVIGKYIFIIWNMIKIYMIAAYCILKELIYEHEQPSNLASLNNHVCIVTGGSRGIGLEAVKQLASLNMTVIIASRSSDEEKDRIMNIPELKGKDIRFMKLDLASLESVRKFAEEFKSLKLSLHILINSAGVMFINEKRTIEGYEHHWCINYLGHFLLSHLLLPLLKESSTENFSSRIVNVTSSCHFVAVLNFDDVNFVKCYSAEAAYSQSKLAQVMFTKLLASKLSSANIPLLANCVHPGVINSQLYENVIWYKLIKFIGHYLLKSTRQGSDGVVHVAVSKSIESGGNYYENCYITSPVKESLDLAKQHKLWQMTCDQLGIKDFGV